MRPLKFRIWNKLDRDWVEYVCGEIGWTLPQLQNNFPYNLDASKVFDFAQFTGLTDKRGKEIYEGDIVAVNMGGRLKPKQVVWGGHWNYVGFGLHGRREDREEWESEFTWDALNATYDGEMEIVGNIYEKRKALEKES